MASFLQIIFLSLISSLLPTDSDVSDTGNVPPTFVGVKTVSRSASSRAVRQLCPLLPLPGQAGLIGEESRERLRSQSAWQPMLGCITSGPDSFLLVEFTPSLPLMGGKSPEES